MRLPLCEQRIAVNRDACARSRLFSFSRKVSRLKSFGTGFSTSTMKRVSSTGVGGDCTTSWLGIGGTCC